MKWNAHLTLLLLLSSQGLAQRGDSLTQRLFTNQSAGATSAAIRNIGQSQHVIYGQWTDLGGCPSLSEGRLYLEGSHDGTNFFPISPRIMNLSAATTASTAEGFSVANGYFPFLRARLAATYVGCRIDAWYSGTIPTAAYPQSPLANSTGYLTALVRPAVAGTTAIVSNTTASARVVVYGLILYNPAATDNSVQIEARDGCPGTATYGVMIDQTNMVGKSPPVILPVGMAPWFVGPAGRSLCLVQSAATAVHAVVIYRIE